MTESPSIVFPKQNPESLGIQEKIRETKSRVKNKIASIREHLNGEHNLEIASAVEIGVEVEKVSTASVAGGTVLCAAGIALLFSGEPVPIMIAGSMIFAGGNKIKQELGPKLKEWFEK